MNRTTLADALTLYDWRGDDAETVERPSVWPEVGDLFASIVRDAWDAEEVPIMFEDGGRGGLFLVDRFWTDGPGRAGARLAVKFTLLIAGMTAKGLLAVNQVDAVCGRALDYFGVAGELNGTDPTAPALVFDGAELYEEADNWDVLRGSVIGFGYALLDRLVSAEAEGLRA